jgi:hypothetical protein
MMILHMNHVGDGVDEGQGFIIVLEFKYAHQLVAGDMPAIECGQLLLCFGIRHGNGLRFAVLDQQI